MKLRRDRLGRLMACSLTVVAIAYGQAASAQETKIEGLITSRNGAQMTVKAATGDFVITLTDATEVKEKEGRLGLRKKQAAVMGLIPGLKVDVHGMAAPQGGLAATSVTFSEKDLQAAQAIQAGLNPTQQQLQATSGQAAANKAAIEANQQQIAKVAGDEADLAKRFGELGNYDVKHEATVFFDAGQATVSATGKKDLDTLAKRVRLSAFGRRRKPDTTYTQDE